ncbi:MAG: DUF1266 domain-containing protein [Nocardiopsaceae bacterium]|nr:DUF1266 domain-containing protein [Nocardiopsaceae bacterium]
MAEWEAKGKEDAVADAAPEIAEAQRALAQAERTLGPLHFTTVTAREKLGYAYDDAGLPDLAWPLLEQAVGDLERTIGPMHRYTVGVRKNLAVAYVRGMRIADALALFQLAAGQAITVMGPLDSNTLEARSGVALCLLEMRRFGEAIASYDRLLPDWAAGFGPAHPKLLTDRHRLACAWDGAGHSQEAMTQYWRLLSDCDQLLGSAAPLTRMLAANLVPPPRPWHATQPLGTHRLWLVALSAILVARERGGALCTLYPSAWLNRQHSVAVLKSPWGVSSRDDLLAALEWLAAEGARESMAAKVGHPPASFDFARYSHVVRNGFAAEYIDEQEAWQLLESIAGQVASAYRSWQEFADDYLAARMTIADGTDSPTGFTTRQLTSAPVARLLDPLNTASPWNLVPWDAIGRPDQPVSTSPGDAGPGSRAR